jgi:hypothetical protein
MKYVVIEYPDTADITSAVMDAVASVAIGAVTIPGGKVAGTVQLPNPAAATLIPHHHDGTAVSGTVSVPASVSGPAVVDP